MEVDGDDQLLLKAWIKDWRNLKSEKEAKLFRPQDQSTNKKT